MKAQIRNALNAGILFGIATAFLVLTGFHLIAASLIEDLLKLRISFPAAGITAEMVNMLIFLILLGIWVGGRGAKKNQPDTWGRALAGGAVAGAAFGLVMALLAFVLGTLNEAGVTLSTYLARLLPAAIRVYLLNQSPVVGALIHLVSMLLAGLLGAALARGVLRGEWRSGASERWRSFSSRPASQRLLHGPRTRIVLLGALALFVFLMPLGLGQFWNYTFGTVGIYVLLGLGLNIVVGLAGLLDLGYVAFFAIGAYSVALLTAPAPHHLLWSFWIALPIGVVLAALAGILLGIPVLRMRGDYLAIVTLGFGEIIRILSRSDLLMDFTGGPRGVANVAGPTLFGRPFSSDIAFSYLILLAVLLVIFFTNRLQNSRIGRAWIAMREDETVARAMGIDTLRFKLLAFSIGAAFAGLGGVLFASRNQFTGPEDHNLMVSINVLCVVIVGGMGSIPGVIAGALALKGLPEVLRELSDYRLLFFGALLVVMMILRPEGLIPSARQRLEMHKEAEERPAEPVPIPSPAGSPLTEAAYREDASIQTHIKPAGDPQAPTGQGEA